MKLCNKGHKFDYETEKLLRTFFPFNKIEICEEAENGEDFAKTFLFSDNAQAFLEIDGKSFFNKQPIDISADEKAKELAVATALFICLKEYSGYTPKWGLLTGVRPAKLYARLEEEMGATAAQEYFKNKLFVSEEKISLCKESHIGEKNIISLNKKDSFSLYVSVPFCPTRCTYCSFVSHSVEKAGKLVEDYVNLLIKEIKETALIAKRCNLNLETVYIGGGTPTTFSSEQLKAVISEIINNFNMTTVREFTVEAGRPDTISEEKLVVLKELGVTRISINPQTMNDEVLKTIGRNHTTAQTKEAFLLARKVGFNNINMDLIAGLPNDTADSFENTLNEVLLLSPESVTVHSLAMKRASSLSTSGNTDILNAGIIADKMVSSAREKLTQNYLLPYYMYRQSKTVGNLENVGYAKKGFECLYNVYIMDETHSILACGASAVTKLREPNGNYIERIFNFKYPYEYISRFEEIINRKKGIIDFYEKYGFGN